MEHSHGTSYTRSNTNPHECWEVYKKVLEETKTLDDYLDEECGPRSFDEGEEEAEWLRAAGLGELTEPWKEGREIRPEELGPALRPLSRAQAEAVKRRVRSLNHTVRQRYNQRQRVRKPDIREVFKDTEGSSTGTRSRSATPDSLDSITGENTDGSAPASLPIVNLNSTNQNSSHVPSFVSVFQRNFHDTKESFQRLTGSAQPASLPIQDIFRRSGHWSHWGDVARGDSDGIKLTAYQKLGTIHLSRPMVQRLADSDLENEVESFAKEKSADSFEVSQDSTLRRNSGSHAAVTRSHSSLYGSSRPRDENVINRPLNRTSSHGHLSFEEMCRAKNQNWETSDLSLDDNYVQQQIELLSQRDLTKLQPLLWLELTSIFDKYNLPLVKRKPNKRRRKAGNLFGVSLSTLLLRDNQLSNEESNTPLVFQKILHELTNRGIREEGILRVGGHKQKVEILCAELETEFYKKPKDMDKIFKRTPCHDLSNILKKLLRDLPQPLLTVELIDAFYQTHGVKNPNDLSYSLNLLVLLLPVEHRCTLKALLGFLKQIVENQESNKMSIHNVAMIVAPSLFPPRYIYPRDRSDLSAQVNMAAVCCQVTEAVLLYYDRLWDVPIDLINQLRRQVKEERYRKFRKKYY